MNRLKIKRLMSLIVIGCLSAAMPLSTGAANVITEDQKNLYVQYQQIVDEKAKTYSEPIEVAPIEWFIENGFPDAEVFSQNLDKNCEPTYDISNVGKSAQTETLPFGLSVKDWSDTKYFSSFDIKVNYSIAYETTRNTDTGKYAFSSFNFGRPTISGLFGNGVVKSVDKSLIDGGRTYVITAHCILTKDNVNYMKDSSCYVYLRTDSGVVVMQGY